MDETEDSGSIADALRAAMLGAPEAEEDPPAADPPGGDTVSGGAGTDTVEAAPGADTVEGGTAAPAEAPVDAPLQWPAAEREAFAALPPASQKFVLNYVNGAQQAYSQAVQAYQRLTAVDQVLAPRRTVWAREGMDDAAAMRQIFAITDYAAQQPQEFLKWFAQAKGIDLTDLLPAQQTTEFTDPRVLKLEQELQTTRATLNQIQGGFQSQAQAQQAQYVAGLDQQIHAFRAETDEKGGLAHPYFNDVLPQMTALLGQGVAPDLKTAYEMACRAHPTVFARIDAAAKAASAQEAAKKAKEKAAAARAAGSSVSGKPGSTASTPTSDDLRDQLRHAFRSNGAAEEAMIQ